MDEKSYEQGRRMSLVLMLMECCKQLGYEDPEVKKIGWISERESVVNSLRTVCEGHGDNDWKSDLHLSDVIDKHLACNLDDNDDNIYKKALQEISELPGHRQDEGCNIALNALDY